jgi:hypothetical protein
VRVLARQPRGDATQQYLAARGQQQTNLPGAIAEADPGSIDRFKLVPNARLGETTAEWLSGPAIHAAPPSEAIYR